MASSSDSRTYRSAAPLSASAAAPGQAAPEVSGGFPTAATATPWDPAEAWGAAPAAGQSWDAAGYPRDAAGGSGQPDASSPSPIYQPGPAPGIEPSGAVPLPPQPARVPGAALAAAFSSDYHNGGRDGQQAWQSENEPLGYGAGAHPGPDDRHDPGQFAGVPQPRSALESVGSEQFDAMGSAVPVEQSSADGPSGAAAVSASASVPLSSRVMPPTDHSLRQASAAPPRPRVYGRPVSPQTPGEIDERTAESAYQQGGQRSPVYGTPRQDLEEFADQTGEPEPTQLRMAAQPPSIPEQRAPFPGPDRQQPGLPGQEQHGFSGGESPQSGFAGREQSPHDFPGREQSPHDFHSPGPHQQGYPGPDPMDQRRFPGPAGPEPRGPFPPAGPDQHGYPDPDNTRQQGYPAPGGPREFTEADRAPFGDLIGPGNSGDRSFEPAAQSNGTRQFNGYPPLDVDQNNGLADQTAVAPSVPAPAQGAPGHSGNGAPWAPTPEPDQNRFDAFRPDGPTTPEPAEQPKAEQPTPQVRNGRVLAAVLTAAVLLLVIPLGIVWLMTKGGEPTFNPTIGSCVKQADDLPIPANCADQGAFEVVSKVPGKEKCPDPAQPHIKLAGTTQVLCLKPAARS